MVGNRFHRRRFSVVVLVLAMYSMFTMSILRQERERVYAWMRHVLGACDPRPRFVLLCRALEHMS